MSRHYSPTELAEGFCKLQTLPEIYFRIKGVLDNPKSQATDLVREINNDPGLTARILRVVNSPLYGMSGKVETTLRAVNVLGTRAIHDLVLATSVTGLLSRGAPGTLNLREHWRLSLLIGMLARAIGQALKLVDKDRLFVDGLLSRIGEIVIHDKLGSVALVVARHASEKSLPLHHAQRNFLGCDYGVVGAALLRQWRLPEDICNVIDRHLDTAQNGEATDVSVLRLAARLAALDATMIAQSETDQWQQYAVAAGWEIGVEILQELLTQCREELSSVEQALIPSTANAA